MRDHLSTISFSNFENNIDVERSPFFNAHADYNIGQSRIVERNSTLIFNFMEVQLNILSGLTDVVFPICMVIILMFQCN